MRNEWWKTEGVLGHVFKTQKQLIEAIREIVSRHTPGDEVTGDDKAFMLDVLRHHYQWEEKSATGVSALTVEHNKTPYGSSSGFWLTRNDGTRIDISWQVPIKPPTAQENVTVAARYEILDQRGEVAAAVPIGAPCPLCGEPLEKGDRHVDHQPPHTFASLLDAFVQLDQATDYALIPLAECGGEGISFGMRFADRTFAEAWREFHRRLATLRVIHKNENLGRKG